MSEKIALIGFVNSEEVLADIIKQQSPNVQVDGYVLFPNQAFSRAVDNAYSIDGENSDLGALASPSKPYMAVNLGPDTAAQILEARLRKAGVSYVGARTEELNVELDKTKIFDIFPDSKGVLPPTAILESADEASVTAALTHVGDDPVVKFVGEYTDYYADSEYRRVRSLSEFDSNKELQEFLRNSIASSGRVILQKRIVGQEFSYTCLVDKNMDQFRLGENIFYKRRFEGDTGPLCDGTGSLAVGNTLPGVVGAEDVRYIQEDIVEVYVNKLADMFGQSPRTFLNVDLIKDEAGKVYLIEINNRQPGGHTMSTLLSGLKSPMAEVLQAAQEDRLTELEPAFKPGASVVVTVFPEISPNDFAEGAAKPTLTVPHNKAGDTTRLYMGWVNTLSENADSVTVESNLTATVIAVAHEQSLAQARASVYAKIAGLGIEGSGLTYRRDIGLYVPKLVTN